MDVGYAQTLVMGFSIYGLMLAVVLYFSDVYVIELIIIIPMIIEKGEIN